MNKQIYFRHASFRNGQKEIIKDIYDSLENNKNILIHAPTGTGKSDAAISAALSYAINTDLKIIFITPKISQHKIALEVIKGINTKYNLNLKAMDFVGKRNMCIDPVLRNINSNFYEMCRQATKKQQCPFYENIKPKDKLKKEAIKFKINKILEDEDILSHIEIKEIAENIKSNYGTPTPVCAYELAKIYAKECKLIIADYYHVFSEKISNQFLNELNIELKDCIVIIDEAHNLEERLLKIQSSTLNSLIVSRAINECKELKDYKLKPILLKLLYKIEDIEKKYLQNKKEELITKEDLLFEELDSNFYEIIGELEDKGLELIENYDKHSSALVSIALFLEEWVKNKEAHIRFVKKEKDLVSIKYNALDVSISTSKIFNEIKNSILMSATLTPLTMYKQILGLNNNTIMKEYNSPFDKNNKLNLLVNKNTTKFTSRNINEYKEIAQDITTCLNCIPGNIIVFFPSFEILRQIEIHVKSGKPKLIQEENQNSEDFEKMINEFKNHSKIFGANLFAVMGGKASEGIDLPGDYLKGAIIVGIPLAKMNIEIKSKIDYYQKKYNNGWLYAYTQPAIQKVIQSAGRVIRTTEDKGVVVYLDKRFLWDNYKRGIPKSEQIKLSRNLSKEIEDFFNNTNNNDFN